MGRQEMQGSVTEVGTVNGEVRWGILKREGDTVSTSSHSAWGLESKTDRGKGLEACVSGAF